MADPRLSDLFERCLLQTASPDELAELSQLLLNPENREQAEQLFSEALKRNDAAVSLPAEKRALILESIFKTERPVKSKIRSLHRWGWVAASIILMLATGTFFWFRQGKNASPAAQTQAIADVQAPQSVKAVITLADGSRVAVDSLTTLKQNSVVISKTEDGKISYQQLTVDDRQLTANYNTLTNPRGSKVIDITLADGSHVWLDAGSSVTYPVAFTGNERKVSVTGQAYFEVRHDDKMPFTVSAAGVEVYDIGTSFNINAYEDEAAIRVTLIEGGIIVRRESSNVKIKPGEQVIASSHSPLTIDHSADIDQVMAWKNGRFQMNNTDVGTIMRQFARWYDVQVVYENGVPGIHLTGKVPNTTSLANAMKMFEYAGLKFKIEDRKLTVLKQKTN